MHNVYVNIDLWKHNKDNINGEKNIYIYVIVKQLK